MVLLSKTESDQIVFFRTYEVSFHLSIPNPRWIKMLVWLYLYLIAKFTAVITYLLSLDPFSLIEPNHFQKLCRRYAMQIHSLMLQVIFRFLVEPKLQRLRTCSCWSTWIYFLCQIFNDYYIFITFSYLLTLFFHLFDRSCSFVVFWVIGWRYNYFLFFTFFLFSSLPWTRISPFPTFLPSFSYFSLRFRLNYLSLNRRRVISSSDSLTFLLVFLEFLQVLLRVLLSLALGFALFSILLNFYDSHGFSWLLEFFFLIWSSARL